MLGEIEKEIKLPVKDVSEILLKISKFAQYVDSVYVLDTIYGKKKNKKDKIRVRFINGKILVIVKKVKISETENIEQRLYAGNLTPQKLEKYTIKYKKENSYEKIRINYFCKGTLFCLDIYPFGVFLEIEGENILKMAKKLGYSKKDILNKNADECYLEWLKNHKENKEQWDVRFGFTGRK